MTLCAPEWFHLRHGAYAYGDVYKNDGKSRPRCETRPQAGFDSDYVVVCRTCADRICASPSAEYFADIAKAYREELADLYAAGCRNVQVR